MGSTEVLKEAPTDVLKMVLNWVPAALAVAMIAFESTPTMSADNTSHWLFPIWVHLFGAISAPSWAEVNHLLRKSGHFIGYGLVDLSFFHAWKSSLRAESAMRRLQYRAPVLALMFTLLVSSADEYHQTFLPSRTGRPLDVGLDLCGAVAAQLLVLAVLPLFTRGRRAKIVPRPVSN